MKNIAIFSVLILIGFGCKKTNERDADLLNTIWTLSFIQDTKTNEVIYYPSEAINKISIVFSDTSNLISFSGVCNGGAGTYTYSSVSGEIKVTDLGSTQIFCKYVEWETYTAQNLQTASMYKINGNSMEIYSNGAYNLYFTHN